MDKMDKILISAIDCLAAIGVTSEERTMKQRLSIDIELSVDSARAAKTDSLKDALDYSQVAVRVMEVCRSRDFHLIETVAELVDVWEAANRDDLFSVTSLKHYPYIANSDFHKPKHLYSWKTLVRCDKDWNSIATALRSNIDVALTLYRNGSWAA